MIMARGDSSAAADTTTDAAAEEQPSSGKIKVPNEAGDVITLKSGADVVGEFKVSANQLITFENDEQRDQLLGGVPGAELAS